MFNHTIFNYSSCKLFMVINRLHARLHATRYKTITEKSVIFNRGNNDYVCLFPKIGIGDKMSLSFSCWNLHRMKSLLSGRLKYHTAWHCSENERKRGIVRDHRLRIFLEKQYSSFIINSWYSWGQAAVSINR